jgi:hypothetical protein
VLIAVAFLGLGVYVLLEDASIAAHFMGLIGH